MSSPDMEEYTSLAGGEKASADAAKKTESMPLVAFASAVVAIIALILGSVALSHADAALKAAEAAGNSASSNGTGPTGVVAGSFARSIVDVDLLDRTTQTVGVVAGDGSIVLAGVNINGSVVMYNCPDYSCSNSSSAIVVYSDKGMAANIYPDVCIGGNGYPIIVWTLGNTHIVTCLDAGCHSSSHQMVKGVSYFQDSVVCSVQSDTGFPLLAGIDLIGANRTVVMAACVDAECTDSLVTTVPVPAGTLNPIAVETGPDGNPMLAFSGNWRGTEHPLALELVQCANPQCSSFGKTYTAPGTANITSPALTFGTDGTVAIAHLYTWAGPDTPNMEVVTCNYRTLGDCKFSSIDLETVSGSDVQGLTVQGNIVFAVFDLHTQAPLFVTCVGKTHDLPASSPCDATNLVHLPEGAYKYICPPGRCADFSLGSNGLPVVVSGGWGGTEVIRCSNRYCVPNVMATTL